MEFWEFFFILLIFVPLVMLWLFTLTDLSRRADLSGPAKGLWAVAVVLLPLIGMLVYFTTRPDSPAIAPGAVPGKTGVEDVTEFDTMINHVERLAELHEAGTLSDEEFAAAKARLIDS